MKPRATLIVILTVFVCAFATPTSANGKTIYVDANAPGVNDGSSWENAYKYLKDTLAAAAVGEKPLEIWVAQGIYRPDEDVLHPDGTSDRRARFCLINEVTMRGGYAGFGEPDPDARDIGKYRTVLSGDLNNDDAAVQDPCSLFEHVSRSENSFNVIWADEVGESAVLDGFTIEGGNANDHSAGLGGGALYNHYARPKLTKCTFQNNSGFRGGAVLVDGDTFAPALIFCRFTGNCAHWEGGAIFVGEYASLMCNSCAFIGNSSRGGGGGILNDFNSGLMLTNCIFSGNSASFGGGVYSPDEAILRLVNCTFIGNRTWPRHYWGKGAGIHTETWDTTIINCIFWGNIGEDGIDESLQIYGYPAAIEYSCVQGWTGGLGGMGNVDADPCFADPGYWDPNGTPEDANDNFWVDGDYHLKSQAGRWEATEGRWTIDDVTSPCIDAGDPMSPIGDEPFPNGGIINMGAYGGTAEASKSYFGKPVCETVVAGDVNGDCAVNFKDFMLMARHWLEEH